jgi:hypothetical protein
VINIKIDPKRIADFVLALEKLRAKPFPPRCRCRVKPIDIIDTGVLIPAISPGVKPDCLKNKTDRTDRTDEDRGQAKQEIVFEVDVEQGELKVK